MRQVLKSGLMITLSLITLAGCNGNLPVSVSTNALDASYSLASTDVTATNALPSATTAQGQVKNKQDKGPKGQNGDRGGKGGKGGPEGGHGAKGGPEGEHGGKGGFGVFGLLNQLSLTADQKTQIDVLLKANKPAKPDQATIDTRKAEMDAQRTAMDALKKEIDTAFVSDNFDVTALKAKVDALKPAKPDDSARITQEANTMIKVYALLNDEQKKLIETKLAEFSANAPKAPTDKPVKARPEKDDTRFDKLATDLALTDAQKTALKEAMQPPTDATRPEPQAMFDKMKATQEAVLAELKTGSASADKIVAILKSNAPEKIDGKHGNELDRLAKIHAILNADQRAKFIANSPKGPEGKGHEGQGSDHQGGGKGPRH